MTDVFNTIAPNTIFYTPITIKENPMNTTLTINGIEYAPTDIASEWRIVIAQRGWVFVGRWSQDGEMVTLTDAKNIRTWGTTKGLGELAQTGPTGKTVLDPAGTVRMHILGVVATLDTQVTTW